MTDPLNPEQTPAPETPAGAPDDTAAVAQNAEAKQESGAEPATPEVPETSAPAKPEAKRKLPHPREVIARFAEAWPAAFTRDPREVKPLAIGVLQQMLADRPEALEGLNSQAIRRGVKFYTSGIAYHRAMLTATHRINLDGSQADEVTQDMRDHAQAQLDSIPKPEKKPRRRDGEGGGEAKTRRRRGPTGPKRDRNAKGGNGRPPRAAQSRPARASRPAQENAATANLSMEDKLAQLARHFSGKD